MPTNEYGTFERVTNAILPVATTAMTWPRFAPRYYRLEHTTLRRCPGCGVRFDVSAPRSEEVGCPSCILEERVPTAARVHRIESPPPVIVEPEPDSAVISPETLAAIAAALRERDLRTFDPLRDDADDAPTASAVEPVVTDVEALRQRLRQRYQAELDARRPVIPEATVATLVQRYRGRFPSVAMATTPRAVCNRLVASAGTTEFRQLLDTDAQLRAVYARS